MGLRRLAPFKKGASRYFSWKDSYATSGVSQISFSCAAKDVFDAVATGGTERILLGSGKTENVYLHRLGEQPFQHAQHGSGFSIHCSSNSVRYAFCNYLITVFKHTIINQLVAWVLIRSNSSDITLLESNISYLGFL